jgi:hypothetical protein
MRFNIPETAFFTEEKVGRWIQMFAVGACPVMQKFFAVHGKPFQK